ncbi:hypothetical protein TRVL_04818 [Trypanosoma vivax]|nr:hypothetical protein TRVL_04818 [Trypanosoma vivax]
MRERVHRNISRRGSQRANDANRIGCLTSEGWRRQRDRKLRTALGKNKKRRDTGGIDTFSRVLAEARGSHAKKRATAADSRIAHAFPLNAAPFASGRARSVVRVVVRSAVRALPVATFLRLRVLARLLLRGAFGLFLCASVVSCATACLCFRLPRGPWRTVLLSLFAAGSASGQLRGRRFP